MEENDLNLNKYFSRDSIFRDLESEDGPNARDCESANGLPLVTNGSMNKTHDERRYDQEENDCRFDADECHSYTERKNQMANFSVPDESMLSNSSNPDKKEDCLENGNSILRRAKFRPIRKGKRPSMSSLSAEAAETRCADQRSKSSGDLIEAGLSQNHVGFFNKLKTKVKSKSMTNIDEKKFNSLAECRRSVMTVLNGVFTSRVFRLYSEFSIIDLHGRHIGGIVPTRQNTCWLYFRGGRNIIRLTYEGVTLETIALTMPIDDMAVDDEDRIYISCSQSKSISQINKQGIVSIVCFSVC